MRIVSLVPHATELLFALGLGDAVVGVTHECDYPSEARDRPHVTRDRLPPGLSPAEIDAAVRASVQGENTIYELDEDAIRALAPDLIVTQALCPVCAVSIEEVEAMAVQLPTCPEVISLDPSTFGETVGDIRTLAAATDRKDAGVDLVQEISARADRVRVALKDAPRRRVAALEWFDPVFVAGHWTPQLVEMAGGFDVLGLPGEHSEVVTWERVAEARPEVVICMPCGYDAPSAHAQAQPFRDQLSSLGATTVVAVDASAYFSRPGPRLVDGLELLAHILHPDLVPDAPGVALPVLTPA
jgi:iron complex transport system substrate-binding protein